MDDCSLPGAKCNGRYKCPRCQQKMDVLEAQARGDDYDGGYGSLGGRGVYYDHNSDGSTNVFPDGQPRGHHRQFPHDKIIIEGNGDVGYFREDGDTTMNSRT